MLDFSLPGPGGTWSTFSLRTIIPLSSSTRNYPLRGYFLGVLAHTTALDRLWRGDGTLNCVEYTLHSFASLRNAVVLVAAAAAAAA